MAENLSLIVPVYNEGENFPALVAEIEKFIPQPFTMYVIYDFEEDTTLPVAREFASTRPWLKLLKNDIARGVVYAIKKGFEHVKTGPALVVMAENLRVPAELLPGPGESPVSQVLKG